MLKKSFQLLIVGLILMPIAVQAAEDKPLGYVSTEEPGIAKKRAAFATGRITTKSGYLDMPLTKAQKRALVMEEQKLLQDIEKAEQEEAERTEKARTEYKALSDKDKVAWGKRVKEMNEMRDKALGMVYEQTAEGSKERATAIEKLNKDFPRTGSQEALEEAKLNLEEREVSRDEMNLAKERKMKFASFDKREGAKLIGEEKEAQQRMQLIDELTGAKKTATKAKAPWKPAYPKAWAAEFAKAKKVTPTKKAEPAKVVKKPAVAEKKPSFFSRIFGKRQTPEEKEAKRKQVSKRLGDVFGDADGTPKQKSIKGRK